MPKPTSHIVAETSGFFVLRTPLLPFRYLVEWSEGLAASPILDDAQLEAALERDRNLLRERLRKQMERRDLRDAVFVASPSLDESFDHWLKEPASERGQKVERSLVRYFERMAARPTPFGLFAGGSTGVIGAGTTLRIEGGRRYQRRTRLDMDYLGALCHHLSTAKPLREQLLYRTNSTLYRAPGRWRYVESKLDRRARSYRLVAVEPTDYLEATFLRARSGARLESLAQALVDNDPSVDLEEAKGFIDELVDSQLLVSELEPLVTGVEPIHDLIARLEQYAEGRAPAGILRRVNTMIEAIDGDGLGISSSRYRAIAKELEVLPGPVELPRLFQVDLIKPAAASSLSKRLADEVLEGIDVLHRVSRPGNRRDALSRFCETFNERYGDQEIPLLEALDEESGIGFDVLESPASDDLPLLHGLAFPGSPTEEPGSPPGRIRLLLDKVQQAQKNRALEVQLSEEDISSIESQDRLPLPDAFSAILTLFARSPDEASKGKYRLAIESAGGPSGARFFGRFCYGDSRLLEGVLRHLRDEESSSPESVYAEIVHLPEERLGNILARPLLRDYEIPFLGGLRCSGRKTNSDCRSTRFSRREKDFSTFGTVEPRGHSAADQRA